MKKLNQVIGTAGGDSSGNNRVRRSSDKSLESFYQLAEADPTERVRLEWKSPRLLLIGSHVLWPIKLL